MWSSAVFLLLAMVCTAKWRVEAAAPNLVAFGFFSCSSLTTTNEFDTVEVREPSSVEILAGCSINRLLLTSTSSGGVSGLALAIVGARINTTVDIRCPIANANVTIADSSVGCDSREIPAAVLAAAGVSKIADVTWRPMPTPNAGNRGLVVGETVTGTAINLRRSCFTTDAGGSSEPTTAFLHAPVIFSGPSIVATTISIAECVLVARSTNLSSSTALYIQNEVSASALVVSQTVMIADVLGLAPSTGGTAPWPSTATGLRALLLGPGSSVAMVNTSILARASFTHAAVGVELRENRDAAAADGRIVTALAAPAPTAGVNVSAMAAAATVVTITAKRTTVDAMTASVQANETAAVSVRAVEVYASLGWSLALVGGTVVQSAGLGNSSACRLMPNHLNGVQLTRINLSAASLVAKTQAGNAVSLEQQGAFERSEANLTAATQLRTTCTGTAGGGGWDSVCRGAAFAAASDAGGLIRVSSSNLRLIESGSIVVVAAAAHAVSDALSFGGEAFSDVLLTIHDATVSQTGGATGSGGEIASIRVDGAVSKLAASWQRSNIASAGIAVWWAGGGANMSGTTFMIDTVNVSKAFTTTDAWLSAPDATPWAMPGNSTEYYLIARCMTYGGAPYGPPGANLVLTCSQCIIWRHCFVPNTADSVLGAGGACTCVCHGNLSHFILDSRCAKTGTFSDSTSRTPTSVTNTTFVSYSVKGSTTPSGSVTKSIDVSYTPRATASLVSTRTLPPSRTGGFFTPSQSVSLHRVSDTIHLVSPSRSRSSSIGTPSRSAVPTASKSLHRSVSISISLVLPIPTYLTPLEEAFAEIGVAKEAADGLGAAVSVAGAVAGLIAPLHGNKGVQIARNARLYRCQWNPHDEQFPLLKPSAAEVGPVFAMGSGGLRYVKSGLAMTFLYTLVAHAASVTLMLRFPFWIKTRVVVGVVAVVCHLYFLPTAAALCGMMISRPDDSGDAAVAVFALVFAVLIAAFPAFALQRMPSLYLAFRMFDRNARRYDQWYIRQYATEDTVVSMGASLLLGIVPASRDSCMTLGLAVCTLWMLHVLYLVVLRPIGKKILLVFAVGLALLQLAVAAAAIGAIADSRGLRALGWLALVEIVAMFLALPVMVYWRFAISHRRAFEARDEGAYHLGGDSATDARRKPFLEVERAATEARFGPDPAETKKKSKRQRELEKELQKQAELERALIDERSKELESARGQFTALTFTEGRAGAVEKALLKFPELDLSAVAAAAATRSPAREHGRDVAAPQLSPPRPTDSANFYDDGDSNSSAGNSSTASRVPSASASQPQQRHHRESTSGSHASQLLIDKPLGRPPPPPPYGDGTRGAASSPNRSANPLGSSALQRVEAMRSGRPTWRGGDPPPPPPGPRPGATSARSGSGGPRGESSPLPASKWRPRDPCDVSERAKVKAALHNAKTQARAAAVAAEKKASKKAAKK